MWNPLHTTTPPRTLPRCPLDESTNPHRPPFDACRVVGVAPSCARVVVVVLVIVATSCGGCWRCCECWTRPALHLLLLLQLLDGLAVLDVVVAVGVVASRLVSVVAPSLAPSPAPASGRAVICATPSLPARCCFVCRCCCMLWRLLPRAPLKWFGAGGARGGGKGEGTLGPSLVPTGVAARKILTPSLHDVHASVVVAT